MWPRDLLPDERHVLDALLARPFDGRDELRQQALSVAVTGLSCTCGCPSIGLAVDRSGPSSPTTGAVANGYGLDADGNIVLVCLLVDAAGYMYDIDVSAVGEDIKGRETLGIHGWPTADSFRLAPDAGEVFSVTELLRGASADKT